MKTSIQNQKFEVLRKKLLNSCLPTETPTKTEVLTLCKGFKLTLWSFLLNKNNKEEIIKKIDNKSRISKLIAKNNLLALCKNPTWKSLLYEYDKIFPKAIYLKELCN